MSAEAAALRLGTTVAKTAADIWLGGRRQQERHLPLAELVRVRVPGLRLQRSVKRQFGQITDAVFDRLEPYLEHEFRGLDEAAGGSAARLGPGPAADRRRGRTARPGVWTSALQACPDQLAEPVRR
ncbi:hypothetical protein ABZ935_23825 [Streptomyces coeruleorubidus]|uniref:NACHT N-terminal Helical domain 1-containing protein n=1 Tax=Streptomyces coeruleorubidus TaxID=116188 RepID=UPI0033C89C9F